MAAIPQARSRQFDEKVDFNDSLEVLKPLVDTLGAQGQRDMMGWTETPLQTLQKKAGSAGTNEAMRDFTVCKVADMNKPRAVTYGNPGTNTMMNPDDWIYARQAMGANLIAGMAPGVVSTEMVNPYKQRGMNSLGATATQTQLYVEGANRQLPFSNLDIEQVEFDATNELRRRTKEETSGWALQQFDPTLISMHHKKLKENTFGLGRLGRLAASQNAFSKSTVINNITNNTNSNNNTNSGFNKTTNIFARGGVGGYGKRGGGGRGGPGGGAGGAGGGDPEDDDGDDDDPGDTGISSATTRALFEGEHGEGAADVKAEETTHLNTINTDVAGAKVATGGMTEGYTGTGVATVDPLGTAEGKIAVGRRVGKEPVNSRFGGNDDPGNPQTGAPVPVRDTFINPYDGSDSRLARRRGGVAESKFDLNAEMSKAKGEGLAKIYMRNLNYVPQPKPHLALADDLEGRYRRDGHAANNQINRDGPPVSDLQTALVNTPGPASSYTFYPGVRSVGQGPNFGMLQTPRLPERLYGDDQEMVPSNPPAIKRGARPGDYNDRDKGRRVVPGESMALISFDNRNRPTVRAGGDYFGERSSKISTTLPAGVVARFTDPDAAGVKRTIGREHLNAPVTKKSSAYHGSSEIVTIDDGNGHLVHVRDVEIIPQYRSSRLTEDAYAAATDKRRRRIAPGNGGDGFARSDVIRRDNGRYAVRSVSGDRSLVMESEHNRENLRRVFNYMKQRSGVV